MILNRSASILHFYKLSSAPKLLSHLRHSYLSLSSSTSSSSSICIYSFWFNGSRGSRTRQFASTAVASAADRRGSDTFYADESVSWISLGLSDRLSCAMTNAGFERPSLVQAACVPLILSGKDVIISAETGSGKTHGYLVPLFDRICTDLDVTGNTTTDQGYAPPHKLSLVLCPNVMLCEQVVRMANGLCGDNGAPLLRAVAVCGRQGWPIQEPDVIVSTPVALLNNLEPNKRHFLHFLRSVKYVVFDEADMLLCGGFQNKVIRLINLLRHSEKKMSQMNISVLKSPVESDSESLSQFDWEDKEEIQNDMEEEHSESDSEVESSAEETETSSIKKKDWKRVRKHYERSKQYIFVAATLPVNGKKTPGAVLKRMFPDAKWVNGNFVHRHNPRLKERWVEVTFDTQVDALMEAVNQRYASEGHHNGADARCTMVFANTVEAVEAVAKILQNSGIKCYRYHKDSPLEERAKTLVDFQEKGGVLVCTDAAARGIDIPNVSHVIQADFATCTVDFLHRVGRTARAGQYGLVTSLYTEANRELVDAIRQAWELGQPVETAFSRKRSFRNKLKKRGLSKVKDTANTELAMA